ncbi:MAG: hypothetical protein CMN18_06815 [Roseovarius sp.]|nr:hypothetical protein [Roseovarius sp.]MBD12411.1 hypothetical protein [Roseovarius sp.]|tara:strand:- start:261 stop:1103 length:843 start_codon:yes stop_codon:yes gene_type:complete
MWKFGKQRSDGAAQAKNDKPLSQSATARMLDQRKNRLLEFVAGCVTSSELGVEIGPFDRPLLTRPDWNVRYADVSSTSELRRLADNSPLRHADRVVEVDYVLKGISLPQAISGASVRYIFGSHVYEHIADLLGFLRQLAAEMGPGGAIIGAFPDRRYTYDIDRPRTTLGQFIDRDARSITQPDPHTVFDHFYHFKPVKAGQVWQHGVNHGVARQFSLAHARKMMDTARSSYVDVHCNILTDQEFVDLTETFPDLGISLRLQKMVETVRPMNEFHFCLKVV